MWETFDPIDPRWYQCLIGCRPAKGIHRADCPNAETVKEVGDETNTGWIG